MLERLISEGAEFEGKAVEVNYGTQKHISGLEFETWIASAIFYLEQHHLKSSLAQKVIQINKDTNYNSYEKYLVLLATLKAAADIEKNQADSFDYTSLNN